MASRNVEAHRAGHQAFNQRDFGAMTKEYDDRIAWTRQRVAWLQVEDDRLRRRLVRRRMDRVAERGECIAVVQQRAVDRAGKPERRDVERDGGQGGHRGAGARRAGCALRLL